MALTEITYPGDGQATFGPIPFDVLDYTTDIKASINGDITTAFTVDPATKKVTFSSTPAIDATIRIYRDTNDETKSATFYSGSAIRASDLNNNFDQTLYLVQEIGNNAVDVDGSNPMVGDLNMAGYEVINLGTPTSDGAAVNKQYVDSRLGNLDIPGFTRWTLTAVGGETTLSGAGTTGGTLTYSAGREQVYLNGAQQQRNVDYTADNGTSVVFNVALTAGDVVEIICVNNLNTGTTAQAQDVSFVQSGAGAVTRSVENKLRDVVSVLDFIPEGEHAAIKAGTSTYDATAAIQAAIESFAPFNQFTTSGGQVYLPPGVYRITSTLDLSGKHGLHLLGSGVQSTELVAVGDFPVITSINTSTTTVNDLQISDLTLRGGGNTQVNAHGIYCVFTNGCSIRNLAIYGCYYGLNLNHSWQFNIENVDMHGGTTDRCHTGVYMGSTTLANIDNAITAYNITVKDCISTGFRIVNGQGSKFVSCEAGAMPTGWHIGEPPSGSVLCQWIHFENCLADSNSTVGWKIAKGSATELSQMQFSNCWSGNSGDDLVLIANANDIIFSNWQLVKAVNHGIRISNSSKIQWNNLQLLRYNTSNTSKQGIYCDNATRCSFSGILTAENSFTDSSFIEVNGSNINSFSLVSSDAGTLAGVDSRRITPSLTQGGAAITQTIKSTGDNSATLTFDNNTNTWETGILGNAGGNYYILVYNGTRVLLLSSTGVLFPETNDSGAIGAAGNRFAASYINKYFVAGSSAFWSGGNNSPEGVVTAPVGSLYSRLDGGAGTTLYIKESGTGNTGWVAK